MNRRAPPTAWKPGVSGNPAGRRPGSGKTGQLREAISAAVPDVLEAMVRAAKSGDVGAARLLLERTLPALKPEERPVTLTLPPDSFTEQGRAVMAATANGELAPSQAGVLLAGLGQLARLAELDELDARVRALEEAAHGPHA